MAPLHILKPAKPSFSSFEFETYNEAIAFFVKSAALKPTKPYKRIRAIGAPLWAVTVVNRAAINAKPEYVPFLRVPGAYWNGCTDCDGQRAPLEFSQE
jgi:hypothetical protein